MTTPNNELVAKLTDVRRAYRLLWAFQKRMLNYNQIIRERLGFTFWSTESYFEIPSKNPENKWVWDLLPMADVSFRSVRHQDKSLYLGGKWELYPKANDAVLYVRLRADTGIPLASHADPSPLTFKPAENCQSMISLFILLNRQDRKDIMNWWIACKEFSNIISGRGKTVSHPTIPDIDIFGIDFDLAELPDEAALLRGIDEFSTAASAALGVSLDQLPRA